MFDANNELNWSFAGNLELYFHRAFVLAKMGKNDEALKAFDLTMKISGKVTQKTNSNDYLNCMHFYEAMGAGYSEK